MSWELFARSWAALFYIYFQSFHWAHGICSLNALKKIFLGGPNRRVFVRPGMTNLTPSPVDCLNLTSKALISEAQLALHSASKVTNFLESSSMLTQRLVARPESITLLMIHPIPAGIWELGGVR